MITPNLIRLALALVSLLALFGSANAAESLRTHWRNQWVSYVEVGDSAVTEGDIIIGGKEAARRWATEALAGLHIAMPGDKALTIDQSVRLWPVGSSRTFEVPYVIAQGDGNTINAALAEVNRVLAGVLQWVPRGTQPDYVSFNVDASGAAPCASLVGRTGGMQQITGVANNCNLRSLLHEMGHAMGLYHVQQDPDASVFVDVSSINISPSKRSQNIPIFSTRTSGGYDYASIMHYDRTGFAINPGLVTLETKPAGMDIAISTTYSLADIDALRRLYSSVSVLTTVTSNPLGLTLWVDGTQLTTPQAFAWPIGSVHRIWADDQAQSRDGYQFTFGRWSHDPSANPSRQLTWQVRPGDGLLGSPPTSPSDTVVSANFVRWMDVKSLPSNAGGSSSITARTSPLPGAGTWFRQYSVFDLRASPTPGFDSYFTNTQPATAFSGGLGSASSVSMLLSPFPTQTLGASFSAGPAIAVKVIGAGTGNPVNAGVMAPTDSGFKSTSIPNLFRTTAGKWTLDVSSPMAISDDQRVIFESLEGFDSVAQTFFQSYSSYRLDGAVTMPSSGIRNVTVRAQREVKPSVATNPSCALTYQFDLTGTFSTNDYLNRWAAVGSTISAALNLDPNWGVFAGWTGSVSGTGRSVSTTVGSGVPEFVANFNTIAEVLTLFKVLPAVVGDETVTLDITGSGFTPQSKLVLSNRAFTTTFVSSNRISLVLPRSSLSAGRNAVFVVNDLSSSCFVSSNTLTINILPLGTKAGVELIEYYHAGLDYYFVTGRPGDIAALDALSGWVRTGQSVKIYAAPNVTTFPLERHFFAQIARGGTRGSHFFTTVASEQILLTALNFTNQPLAGKPYLEGVEGYAVPTDPSGGCPGGTIPIFRAFKGAPRYVDDGNHRFSANLAQHLDMVNRLGWTDEGVKICGLR